MTKLEIKFPIAFRNRSGVLVDITGNPLNEGQMERLTNWINSLALEHKLISFKDFTPKWSDEYEHEQDELPPR